MTTDTLIDNVITREGGFVHAVQDRGGATNMGITAATLGAYRRLGRVATDAEVRALGPLEAKDIYRVSYVRPFELIPFDELRAQLVDFGVLSGVGPAIQALQRVLDVPVDGIIGERTRSAVAILPWRLVNQGLVAARVKLFVDLVAHDHTQAGFLLGWCVRAVSFSV
jgi:lysozyme family protein